jgi:hypothetical protein
MIRPNLEFLLYWLMNQLRELPSQLLIVAIVAGILLKWRANFIPTLALITRRHPHQVVANGIIGIIIAQFIVKSISEYFGDSIAGMIGVLLALPFVYAWGLIVYIGNLGISLRLGQEIPQISDLPQFLKLLIGWLVLSLIQLAIGLLHIFPGIGSLVSSSLDALAAGTALCYFPVGLRPRE